MTIFPFNDKFILNSFVKNSLIFVGGVKFTMPLVVGVSQSVRGKLRYEVICWKEEPMGSFISPC